MQHKTLFYINFAFFLPCGICRASIPQGKPLRDKINIKAFIIIVLSFFTINSFSQIGGNGTYEFLNLPNSARVASLGGNFISVKDDDLNLTFHNPSLLNSSMHNQLVLNYVRYFPNTSINYGYVSYARSYDDLGNFAVGLHYINYGEFIAADETGQITGNFNAAEYALNLFWSKPLDSLFSCGVNLKPILSVLEHYQSFGIALDAGITYYNPEKLFTAALVIKNFGTQITPYYKGNYEPIAFDVQFGISKRLKHAPLRFSFLAQHLETPDMTYENPNDPKSNNTLVTGDTITETKFQKFTNNTEKFADKVMRHIIISAEFNPVENFYIRFGYNYQRRKELQLVTRTSLVGMSWGFGIKISKFHFSYGRATYHLAGATNHFSITTNLSAFLQKQ